MSGPRPGTAAMVAVAALAVLAALFLPAAAGTPATPERQAEELAARLRCPSCQGISVADSPSPIARRMYAAILAELRAGRTPEQVEAGLVAAYGDWIRLEPPRSGLGLIAWWIPALAAFGALAVFAGAQFTGRGIFGRGVSGRGVGGRVFVGRARTCRVFAGRTLAGRVFAGAVRRGRRVPAQGQDDQGGGA